jgi:ArsR family transcriptional regulator
MLRRKASPLVRPVARLFQALADESRLTILAMLAEQGELSVTAIGRELGQSQPAVSHHLTQLRSAKLIDYRREGKFNFYRLDDAGIAELMDALLIDGKVSVAGLEISIRMK